MKHFFFKLDFEKKKLFDFGKTKNESKKFGFGIERNWKKLDFWIEKKSKNEQKIFGFWTKIELP